MLLIEAPFNYDIINRIYFYHFSLYFALMPSENPSVSSQPPENNTPSTSKISAEETGHQPLATAHLSNFSRALALSTALATATPALAENSAENQPVPTPPTAPQKISAENSPHPNQTPTDYIAQMAKNALNAVIPSAEAAETTLEKPPKLVNVDLDKGTVTIYRQFDDSPGGGFFVANDYHERTGKYIGHSKSYHYTHKLNDEEAEWLEQVHGVQVSSQYPIAADMPESPFSPGLFEGTITYPIKNSAEISAEKNGDTPPDGMELHYDENGKVVMVSVLNLFNGEGNQIDINTGEKISADFSLEQEKFMSDENLEVNFFYEKLEDVVKIGSIELTKIFYKVLAFSPIYPRSHAPAWERREMLNTKEKLMQATNPKLTHSGTKIIFRKLKICIPTQERGNGECR